MDISRKPDLEILRNSVFTKLTRDYDAETKTLIEQCENIHSIYLFHPDGIQTLKNLCLVMSSTPASIHYSSWKDLAAFLGLSFHQIGCIENYKHEDSTEMVLKTFAQSRDATLGSIIEGLNHCKRYDAISIIEKPLKELIETAKRHKFKISDYLLSKSISAAIDDGILRPNGFSQFNYQLPITLRQLMGSLNNSNNEKNKAEHDPMNLENKPLQQSRTIRNTKKCYSKISKRVMLTFSKDGETMANLLARELRKPNNGRLPIGVLILNEHPDKVMENPERFITHYFAKMDFIIPIITEGYLEALGNKLQSTGTWNSSIDPQYVILIHDLMSKYYVENCCRNDKVRCITPNNHFERVIKHNHMKIDPVLRVYFRENEINDMAERILRAKKTGSSKS